MTYAVYVEKELVGKRIKSSKIKVLWQICFEETLGVHQIELRHSIVSGKREVLFDNDLVYNNKQMFQGTFEFRSKLKGHDVHVTVEDTFEGYLYDLIVDGIAFHRMPRKTMGEIEDLRDAKKNEATTKMDFASFTGKSTAVLDGKAKKKQQDDDVNLLGDWGETKPQETFNPFDSMPAPAPQYHQAPPQQQQPVYAYPAPAQQPVYGVPQAYSQPAPSYAQPAYPSYPPAASPAPSSQYDPFAMPAPAQQPYPGSVLPPYYQAPPKPQQPLDPFAPSSAFPQQSYYASNTPPPQQQPKPYDPFA